MEKTEKTLKTDNVNDQIVESSLESESILIDSTQVSLSERELSSYTRKRHGKESPSINGVENASKTHVVIAEEKRRSWRRILLLIVAITVHNIPGEWMGELCEPTIVHKNSETASIFCPFP